MSRILLAVSLGIATSLSFKLPAYAVSIFTNRVNWENALRSQGIDSLRTDTFENDIPNGSSIIFDSGVISNAFNGDLSNRVFSGGYFVSVDTDNDNGGRDLFDRVEWIFPDAIRGFGARFAGLANNEGLQISGNFDGLGNQTIDLINELGPNNSGFLGIIGESSFTEITLTSRIDDSTDGIVDGFPITNEGGFIDDLSFGPSSQAVPEAHTFLGSLLILGLGIGMKRRNKAST